MKCLTVRNPYADWIADGKKTIETRTWPTKHRGQILIHTAKIGPGPNNGKIVATAELVDCRPMKIEDEQQAWCRYFKNLYAWVLKDAQRIKYPVPAKGQLSLYEVKYDFKTGNISTED